MNKEKVILVAGYGTSYLDEFENIIMKIIKNINNKFKEYEVILGFTSEIIITRLKEKQGIKIYSIYEALNQIKKDKYKEVIVQPLHLIAGLEYEKIVQVSNKYEKEFDKMKVGKPIFIEAKDYDNIVNIIVSKFPGLDDNKGIVLMGHGTKDYANISYKKLQDNIEDKNLNIFVGTIEDNNINEIIEKLKDNNIKNVYLASLTLTFGYHGKVHMAGDNKGSWKNILLDNGFDVSVYTHGLGEYEEFIKIYIHKIEECINSQ